ncbi:MAG TPA: ABC transporter permease [Tepidisphaeraceae bacterium]
METLTYEPNERRASRRFNLPRLQEAGLLVVIAVMWTLLGIKGYHDAAPGSQNTFLNSDNLISGVATPMSYYAIMAVGVTFVIIAGGIDISVGSIFALSALLTAWTLQQFPSDASPLIVGPISLLLPLAVGLFCGLINGALVVSLRLHPFIVTLGTMAIFRGTANVLPFPTKTLPSAGVPLPDGSVTHLFKVELLGMPLWPMIVMLLVTLAGWFYLRCLVAGRENYAIGGNEEAARFSGIPVPRVKLQVYALSGALAGLAGLVSLGRFGTISTNSATGYELTVIAAAVVGGASLTGGRGTAIGALLGTLVLATIENAINTLRLNQDYKSIIVGSAIVIAAALDRLSEYLAKRRAAGARKTG